MDKHLLMSNGTTVGCDILQLIEKKNIYIYIYVLVDLSFIIERHQHFLLV